MKKVVQADLNIEGPKRFSGKLPQPETVDNYYRDYCAQAFPRKGLGIAINPEDIIDLTDKLHPDGRLEWDVPEGRWVLLRTGYTVTPEGQFKYAYPNGDTYEWGHSYQIDFLNTAAFDDHFEHLGKPILDVVRQAGGRLAYLWSDRWECGKLTWTQDIPNQFRKYRGYDLKPYLSALPGAITWMDNTASFTATAETHTLSFVGTNQTGGVTVKLFCKLLLTVCVRGEVRRPLGRRVRRICCWTVSSICWQQGMSCKCVRISGIGLPWPDNPADRRLSGSPKI